MPAGFTHILLVKNFNEKSGHNNLELEALLDDKMDYLQLGAIGPDLPYSQVLSSEMKEIADHFHWHKTNQVVLRSFHDVKGMIEGDEKDECFCFFLGLVSHIVADGIIHPFVRDKVGPYKEGDNATKHRLLEMRLDVILSDHMQGAEINCSKFQDELVNPLASFDHVAEIFSRNINGVYGKNTTKEDIKFWVNCMEKLFEAAANENNQYYANFPGVSGFLYKDAEELRSQKDKDVYLENKTIDGRNQNFRNKETDFLIDCVPKYYDVLEPIFKKAYEFVYKGGDTIFDESILPAINLDTGRSLSDGKDGYNLDSKAIYWEM